MDAASVAFLDEAIRASSGDEFGFDGIWPDNEETVRAFLAVCTQWRIIVLSGAEWPPTLCYIGLDYSAVRAGLDAEGFSVTPELWRDLRVMEVAACAALNEVTS
jgi:hypothetical protein